VKTVTVVAPLCAPDRQAMTGTIKRQLGRYKFRLGGVSAEQISEDKTPLHWLVRVHFTDDAATWGEYVLARHGYEIVGPWLEPRNREWAAPYLQARPEKGPWHGPECRKSRGETGGLANPPPAWEDEDAQHPWARRDWWRGLTDRKPQSRQQPARRKRKPQSFFGF